MIAVRVSRDQRAAIVAAPRWEFDKGNESLTVGVHGPLVMADMDMTIRAVIDGIGLAFSLEDLVPAVRGLLSLLPESTAAAGGTVGSHRQPFACSYSSFNSPGIGGLLAPRLTCTTRTTFALSSTVKKMRFT